MIQIPTSFHGLLLNRSPRWAVDMNSPTELRPLDSSTVDTHFNEMPSVWTWIWFILFLSTLATAAYCLYPFRRIVWFIASNRCNHTFSNCSMPRYVVIIVDLLRVLIGNYTSASPSSEDHVSVEIVQVVSDGSLALCSSNEGRHPCTMNPGEESVQQVCVTTVT